MISFIIIGRNEGWKLTQCLRSVYDTINFNALTDYEIIYIDSKSSDDSIERALAFEQVRILQITGVCNAAIARNIGANNSKGETLFFIDGDMEIQPDFLPLLYTEKRGLKHEFGSGQWINYNYDNLGNLMSKQNNVIPNIGSDQYFFTTGGLFLIKRKNWTKVGGMKNKLQRNEDIDLGVRLAKLGILLLRKKELIAIHHTIPYDDKIRMWEMLFSGAQLFRVVLLRDNFLNKYQWKLFARENYTFFILLMCLVLALIFLTPYPLLIYFFSVLGRSYARNERSIRLLVSNLVYITFYEAAFVYAFMFFWPKNRNSSYQIL